MKRMRSIGLTVVLAIAACVTGVLFFQRQQARAASAGSASQAPIESFYRQKLADATGVVHDMAEHRGHVVVVNFWATWCVPCVKEIPGFSKVHRDAGGRVDFVGLGIDSPANIASFNERLKPSYPLYAAGAGGTELARAFGDDGGALPFTVVLGADGRILQSHLGIVDDAMLRAWLAPYLVSSPAPSRS